MLSSIKSSPVRQLGGRKFSLNQQILQKVKRMCFEEDSKQKETWKFLNTHASRNELNFKKCKVITKFLQKREKETVEENEFISIKEPSEYLKRV